MSASTLGKTSRVSVSAKRQSSAEPRCCSRAGDRVVNCCRHAEDSRNPKRAPRLRQVRCQIHRDRTQDRDERSHRTNDGCLAAADCEPDHATVPGAIRPCHQAHSAGLGCTALCAWPGFPAPRRVRKTAVGWASVIVCVFASSRGQRNDCKINALQVSSTGRHARPQSKRWSLAPPLTGRQHPMRSAHRTCSLRRHYRCVAGTPCFRRSRAPFARLRRSAVTVAQLVRPAYSVARHSPRAFFRRLHHTATQRCMRDAALWRAIGIGGAFAATGFAIMASALAG
jgi:hypothetical protein